jgi:hypothetical protein
MHMNSEQRAALIAELGAKRTATHPHTWYAVRG